MNIILTILLDKMLQSIVENRLKFNEQEVCNKAIVILLKYLRIESGNDPTKNRWKRVVWWLEIEWYNKKIIGDGMYKKKMVTRLAG